MTDGSGERGVSKGRKSSPRERPSQARAGQSKAQAGPPKFMNRIPSRALSRSSLRPALNDSRTRLDYIPLTRVRPALDILHGEAAGDAMRLGVLGPAGVTAAGGRPFAPRVSIERGDLPGGLRLDVRFDFEARIARATSLAFALPTPKRHTRLYTVGSAYTGVAFALLYESSRPRSPRGEWMKTPAIRSLDTVSLEEALAYVDASEGDELGAAFALATDRNLLAGSSEAPDDAEVHHALFLLRRARGLDAPSFDLMRVQLKRRVAA